MRFRWPLFILVFAAAGLAASAQPQEVSEDARTLRVFADRVQNYVRMQKDLEESGSPPAGNATKDSEEIGDREHALAGRIAAARRGSRQGDIFTHEVAEQFEKIIRKAFKEPGGRAMRKTIEEREHVRPFVLSVNAVYPEGLTRTTMPPTLLSRLPALPKELTYRIVGQALVLENIRANLIVDFIPKAIP